MDKGQKTAALLGIVAGPGALEAAITHAMKDSEKPEFHKEDVEPEPWWSRLFRFKAAEVKSNVSSQRQESRAAALESASKSLAETLKGVGESSTFFYAEGMNRRRFRSIARDKAKRELKEARLAKI